MGWQFAKKGRDKMNFCCSGCLGCCLLLNANYCKEMKVPQHQLYFRLPAPCVSSSLDGCSLTRFYTGLGYDRIYS